LRDLTILSFSITIRGSQEPVIVHLVFNLTSKVDRKWGFIFQANDILGAVLEGYPKTKKQLYVSFKN
jgi:hypothetical protein